MFIVILLPTTHPSSFTSTKHMSSFQNDLRRPYSSFKAHLGWHLQIPRRSSQVPPRHPAMHSECESRHTQTIPDRISQHLISCCFCIENKILKLILSWQSTSCHLFQCTITHIRRDSDTLKWIILAPMWPGGQLRLSWITHIPSGEKAQKWTRQKKMTIWKCSSLGKSTN